MLFALFVLVWLTHYYCTYSFTTSYYYFHYFGTTARPSHGIERRILSNDPLGHYDTTLPHYYCSLRYCRRRRTHTTAGHCAFLIRKYPVRTSSLSSPLRSSLGGAGIACQVSEVKSSQECQASAARLPPLPPSPVPPPNADSQPATRLDLSTDSSCNSFPPAHPSDPIPSHLAQPKAKICTSSSSAQFAPLHLCSATRRYHHCHHHYIATLPPPIHIPLPSPRVSSPTACI